MGARTLGRERALQALYQLEVTPGEVPVAVDGAFSSEDERVDPDARRFALDLAEGVRQHLTDIDKLIEAHSTNWRLDRMARVDRSVLRLATYELMFRPDIPRKVTLNEAVELGKRFGAEDSSAFINGLLDKIAAQLNKP
ncbi:MAG: transcription antitermination factor NusB [Myxococcaceae bacterium]